MSHASTRVLFCTCALIALVSAVTPSADGPPSRETALKRNADPRPRTSADIRSAYLRTPLRFEQHGQAADFVARGIGYGVRLSDGDATLVLNSQASPRPDTLSIRLTGRRAKVQGRGRQELPGRSNYIIGSDPRAWTAGVSSYGQVEYREVYPGIDVVFYGNQRQLEFDFVVAPGAAPSTIALEFYGAQHLSLDDDGNLVVTTASGVLTQRAPTLYQHVDGARRSIDGGYVIREDGQVGFTVGAYDARLPLVIDPILNYATYLGGVNEERIHGVAVDANGNMIVAGETYSPDFPTANAFQGERRGNGDAFVAKLTPAGDGFVYATYFGGSSAESAMAVDVDASGAAYIVGSTSSWDFPTLNPIQSDRRGWNDTFVVKLTAGGALVYSTLLGGASEDYANAVAVDSAGRAHVAGSTWSGDFPAVNALQPSLGGYPVLRTLNGGETWNGQTGIRTSGVTAFAIDPATPETVYAGTRSEGLFKTIDEGATWASVTADMPFMEVYSLATGAGSPATVYAATNYGVLRSHDGGTNWMALPTSIFVTALAVDPVSSSTLYAGGSYGVLKTTDGGDSWTDTGLNETIVALSVSGSTVYAASSYAVFTSTAGAAWTGAHAGLPAQIITVVADPSNASVAYVGSYDGLFKTTTGGADWQLVQMIAGVPIGAIALAPSNPSTVYASTYSALIVSPDAGENWQLAHPEGVNVWTVAVHPSLPGVVYMGLVLNADGFVATLSAEGSMLEYSTYFGGSAHDAVTDLALGANGQRYIAGTTMSTDLPVRNALQSAAGGLQDAFAARLDENGQLVYSTYLGGWGSESGPAVAVDAVGQAHVAGLTYSTNYPVVNAHQPQPAGGFSDVFVSVLNTTGSGFVYSTYLGGSNQEVSSTAGRGPDVAITSAGETYVTGTTTSADFPTTLDALQRVFGGGQNDAFLTKYDAAGTLRYSTYIGGNGTDYAQNVVVDSQDAAIVTGYTNSTNLPARDALQPARAGSDDGFIARFGEGSVPVDTVAPVTTINVAGTPGLEGWYRSPVTVTLSASDGESGSGVSLVQYRLNGGALQNYALPFTISSQGVTMVSAQSTDAAGNVENPAKSASAKIDSVAPAVSIASPLSREYLYNYLLPVSVSASDSMSGLVARALVTVDGTPVSGSTIDLSTLALGAHVLVASATDRAGNTAQATVTFQVVAELDTVINVPAEAATIQAAIDRAINGETVLVAPGTYNETINFLGKAITVTSEAGPEVTIIDARGTGSVVTFRSGETRASVLSGFTIRGGFNLHNGGGISIGSSSPTIRGNVITENRSCTGVGVYSTFGSPLIQNNRIVRNAIQGCTGGWGIGVYIGGNSSAEVVDNDISDNTGGAATGGGVALFAAGNAVVRGNVIARNVTNGPGGCGWGGGLASANFIAAKIVNNLIVGNVACGGGGVYWGGSTGSNVFVNNTIADNEAATWPGMYVSGFDSRNQLHNNIITAKSGPAFYCQNAVSLSSPVLSSNDIFSAEGAAYGGTCADQSSVSGNISADPQFLDPAAGDYRVRMSSPVVDAGNDSAPDLPATDVARQKRIVDGNGDGTPQVDMGALEYRNRAPIVNAGADQTVDAGSDCRAQVTLNGTATDADGDALTFTWSGDFGTVSGPTLPVVFSAGSHILTLTVDDANGGYSSDTVVVTVRDTTPPAIASVTATPSVLQRSNHEMVPVVVSVSVADVCDGRATCRIVSVASNEPVEGTSAGETTPDWEVTGDLTLNLRAERLGKGSGRIYTITVACSDLSGNRSTSTVTVSVPK